MTEYSDLNQVNTLYMESQQVAQAINMIDGGGSIGSITITPPPSNPEQSPPVYMMPTTILLPSPAAPELVAEVRVQLVERETEIANQLASLGVTATPPAHTQREQEKK